MTGAKRWWMVVVAALGLVLPACSSGGPSPATRAASPIAADTASSAASATRSSTTSTSTSTSSTVAKTTVPTTVPPGLGRGARGPDVLALEQHLNALHYDVGTLDDVFDQNTAYAVTAFQKVMGMDRTGRATDDVIAALATATPPPPLVPNGNADRVEIDIPRQVLFLYKGGAFGIYRQGTGWEYGPLGGLYNPQYFNGGIAIHGATSVPAYPASHGCIRIPMAAAEWFPGQVYPNMAVHVVGVPGQPLDPDIAKPVTSPQTTTVPTTAPATTTTAPDLLGGLLKPRS